MDSDSEYDIDFRLKKQNEQLLVNAMQTPGKILY